MYHTPSMTSVIIADDPINLGATGLANSKASFTLLALEHINVFANIVTSRQLSRLY